MSRVGGGLLSALACRLRHGRLAFQARGDHASSAALAAVIAAVKAAPVARKVFDGLHVTSRLVVMSDTVIAAVGVAMQAPPVAGRFLDGLYV